jgi:serine O-acetyltransferase
MTNKEISAQSLDIGIVVKQLRDIRLASLESRNRRGNPPKLPSRKTVAKIVEGIASSIYPHRLGTPDVNEDGIDYFVGHMLDVSLRDLLSQIKLELQFSSGLEALSKSDELKSVEITKQFAASLPEIRLLLDSDLRAAFEGDPAAKTPDEILVCYPGIQAITHYRIAHLLHVLGSPLIARMISEIAHSATGIDIHPGAQIGPSFFIDHGTGVVIGETSIIGKNVRLYQAVTLGAKRFPTDEKGVLIKGNERHPIVEDDVVIYAGATILGRVVIGRSSVIGGNVWLTRSVPPGSNITQAQMLHHPIDGAEPVKEIQKH